MYYKFLKSRVFFLTLGAGPLLYIIYAIIFDKYTANPAEFFLLTLGNGALYFYLATIYVSPLNIVPQLKKTVGLLKKKRKTLGLTCFFYAVLHLTLYVLANNDPEVLLSNFKKPFILIGTFAFIILLVLSITSLKYVTKRLSPYYWKHVHRMTHIIPVLLALHITSKDKGNPERAVMLFLPLFVLQSIRLYKYIVKKKRLRR